MPPPLRPPDSLRHRGNWGGDGTGRDASSPVSDDELGPRGSSRPGRDMLLCWLMPPSPDRFRHSRTA
eukprot:scaffold1951_cov258-Pinguiococcus_pyrenoidosus.AAC.12